MINTRIYGGEGDEKDFESQKFVCIYVHFVWLRGGFGGALTCPYKRAINEFGRERYRVGGLIYICHGKTDSVYSI